MSTTLERPVRYAQDMLDRPAAYESRRSLLRDPRYQAFWTLRLGFTILPIAMGIDKFFNAMVSWPKYLADWVDNIAPGTAQQFMYLVGGVEIVAGLLVLLKPRYAAYIVAAWLAAIIVNLLVMGAYLDVALRDLGLMLGAIALGRLAQGVHEWKER